MIRFVLVMAVLGVVAVFGLNHFREPAMAHSPDVGESRAGPAMVKIPAGSFLMGACQSDNCVEIERQNGALFTGPQDEETPVHQVNVAAFQMSRTEITVGKFRQFIAAAGRTDLLTPEFEAANAYGDSIAVVWVSWEEAQAFIQWLNSTDGDGWRLPTEAEWEYACRAGSSHYHCGNDVLGEVGWHMGNSGQRPQPVGLRQANAFGLHDMSGNVWEWVQDCWHDSYVHAPMNGDAWLNDCSDVARVSGGEFIRGPQRVIRGGSWYNTDWLNRASSRYREPADGRAGTIGFRMARSCPDNQCL